MSLSLRNLIRLALLLSFSLIFGATVSMAQEKMSMEDYNAQLAQWQEREAAAKKALDELIALDPGHNSMRHRVRSTESGKRFTMKSTPIRMLLQLIVKSCRIWMPRSPVCWHCLLKNCLQNEKRLKKPKQCWPSTRWIGFQP